MVVPDEDAIAPIQAVVVERGDHLKLLWPTNGFPGEDPDNTSLGMCALGLVDHDDVLAVAGGVVRRMDPVTLPGFESADVFGGPRGAHIHDT